MIFSKNHIFGEIFYMGLIEVKNIRVYAYHGCLDEEGKIGSEYRVDLA